MYTYEEVYNASISYFNGDELAAKVFVDKYALQNNNGEYLELTPKDMHRRLAKEFARIENKYSNPMSEEEIFNLLDNFKYIVPQGSPMYGVGNDYFIQSLGNCFVVNSPYDSYGGILNADQELAQLMKRRCGVGIDISTIRPKGMATKNAAKTTDGIGIFMERFSNTTREVAQCLHKDTLILTLNGLKPIKDIIINDKVWTNKKWVNVDNILKNKKNIYKIKTKHGKEILASSDHIFHCIDKERKVKDLKIGNGISQIVGEGWFGKEVQLNDTISFNNTKTNKNVKLPKILNTKLAYILGQMYGDGYVEKSENAITIASSDDWKDIEIKIKKYVFDTFNYDVKIQNKKNERCSKIGIYSKEIVAFLKNNNILKQKAENIIFPESLFLSNKEVVFSFISGFFDADGYVSSKKKSYKISSINEKFLQSIQNIFSSYGIISKISVEKRKNNWKDLYSLSINGQTSQDIFRSLMIESVKITSTKFTGKTKDHTRSVYNIRDLGSNSTKHKYITDNNQKLSYSSMLKAKSDLNLNKNTFLFCDSIESIEDLHIEDDVYDLVLSDEHLFFANGLYAHNSGRRGALMLSIAVNHPEIETFINIKKDLKKVTGANVSIRISDDFMNCVKNNSDFILHYPTDKPISEALLTKVVKAKEIWNQIIDCAWTSAEPGILFWDTIINNSPADIYANNYHNFKTQSTNPCGELPLGLDSCRLLLTNLSSFVDNPYTSKAKFNFDLFSKIVQKSQRLMDDLIDLEIEKINKIIDKINLDPEPRNIKEAELNMWKQFLESCEQGRRTGTGITALGDCIAMLNIKYGSEESVKITEEIYKILCINAYKSSSILAQERGAFPIFDANLEKDHKFLSLIYSSDKELFDLYSKYGRRNVSLLTTAPTGSVSTLTQTTSGIEPAYLLSYLRRKKINPSDVTARVDFVDQMGDKWQEFIVYHHGVKKWMDATGETDITKSPYYGATSNDIDWIKSVEIQSVAQKWVDHSISKTCVTRDTLIETENGLLYLDEIFNIDSMKTNESLKNLNNIKVKNCHGNFVEPSHFHNMGINKIINLSLDNGLSIKVTPKERFLVLNDDTGVEDWKYIEDIELGDRVKIS